MSFVTSPSSHKPLVSSHQPVKNACSRLQRYISLPRPISHFLYSIKDIFVSSIHHAILPIPSIHSHTSIISILHLPPRRLPLALLNLNNLPVNQLHPPRPPDRHEIIHPSDHHKRAHSPDPHNQPQRHRDKQRGHEQEQSDADPEQREEECGDEREGQDAEHEGGEEEEGREGEGELDC